MMSESTLTDFYIGRQAILNRGQALCAFELLFRAGTDNWALVSDNRAATASVISHAFGELGLARSLGNYRGFINVDAKFLLSDTVELLPARMVVLEILETVEVTRELIARCAKLKSKGFSFALDDICHVTEDRHAFFELAEIVKVEIGRLSDSELEKTTRDLRKWPVKLLAEKIDHSSQAKFCFDLGYDYFQGYYYARPEIVSGKKLNPSELTLLNLMALLMRDAESGEIEQSIKQSPTLTLNLLRIANSVAGGLRQKVVSLHKAITLLGRRQLQRWVQLLLFAGKAGDHNFPSPLLQLAAARGKFMELLMEKVQPGNQEPQDRAFMVGIMSLMPTVLSLSIVDILKSLPVDEELHRALVDHQGVLGDLLRLAEVLDHNSEYETLTHLQRRSVFTAIDVAKAQAESLAWANSIGISNN
jgi:c-di-GMP-related signal transduction protein